MADQHGPLFDNFRAQSGHPHGGATFDAGFGLQGLQDPHGNLFDRFEKPQAGALHGSLYDEFGWRPMPNDHGHTFDSDFSEPVALDGSEGHATWFDAFTGGTQVRYTYDGLQYEGVVIDLDADEATIDSGGKRHGIGIEQILEWREAPAANIGNRPGTTAEPGNTDTSVVRGPQGERPSGESHEAMGGGERTQPRPGWETAVIALKDNPEALDVLKRMITKPSGPVVGHVSISTAGGSGHINYHCKSCGPPAHSTRGFEIYRGEGAGKTCATCKKPLESGVAKSVESTETAVQSQDLEGGGKTAHCPHCDHTCKKPRDGKCPECGTKVVYKTEETDGDVEKSIGGQIELSRNTGKGVGRPCPTRGCSGTMKKLHEPSPRGTLHCASCGRQRTPAEVGVHAGPGGALGKSEQSLDDVVKELREAAGALA